jgi:uncharacterized membrane protein YhaH (DUF805 family)
MPYEPENKPVESEDVIADYVSDVKKMEMETYARSVRRARNALYWTAGLLFAGEMIGMYRMYEKFEPIIFVIALIEAAIFIALALWTKKKPYTAIITGLIVFISLLFLFPIAISLLFESSLDIYKSIFSAPIVKIVILVNLITPLKDARALQEGQRHEF